jgi:hypothetical protein
MKRLVLASLALLSNAWLAACGGGDTISEQPPSPIDEFAQRYADATCGVMTDCCKTGGFGYYADRCKFATSTVLAESIYTALATLKVHFDKDAAEQCLSARVELYRTCMGDGKAELDKCNAMLVGEVPMGSSCNSKFECMQPSGMVVTCVPDAPNSMKGHCAVVPPAPDPPTVGKSGDACSATCRSSVTDGCTTVDGAPSASACLVADGLVCDTATLLCAAVPMVGEACTSFCATGAYCDAAGKCQPKTADGPCPGNVDACVDASICACGEATCDPSKFMCVARGPVGAQCKSDKQCTSGFCYQNTFCRTRTPVSQALCEGDL